LQGVFQPFASTFATPVAASVVETDNGRSGCPWFAVAAAAAVVGASLLRSADAHQRAGDEAVAAFASAEAD